MRYLFIILLFNLITPSVSAQTAEEFLQKGYLLAYNGDYASAIKLYDKAIKLNPNLAKAYYNRGHVKYDLKDYEGAVKDCLKAIALDNNMTDAFFNITSSFCYRDMM